MIRALLRYWLFIIPTCFIAGTASIIFDDIEIASMDAKDFFCRSEEKLDRDVGTLENILEMEQEDNG